MAHQFACRVLQFVGLEQKDAFRWGAENPPRRRRDTEKDLTRATELYANERRSRISFKTDKGYVSSSCLLRVGYSRRFAAQKRLSDHLKRRLLQFVLRQFALARPARIRGIAAGVQLAAFHGAEKIDQHIVDIAARRLCRE